MIDLRLGDCLEVMKDIPDKSIDLTVTSPPYDNLRFYNGFSWNFEAVANELYRVTKDGGIVVWVVNDATVKGSETGTSFRQSLYFMDIGFRLHDTMIYQKNSMSYPETNRYYPSFEYMFILSKGKPKTTNLISDKQNKTAGSIISGTQRRQDGRVEKMSAVKKGGGKKIKKHSVRTNIWCYDVGFNRSTKDKIAFRHPAIFPEALAKDHIISWSNKGEIVFDPFMGSGTTGKMAKETERSFIGIELDESYFNIAKERILGAENEQTTIR